MTTTMRAGEIRNLQQAMQKARNRPSTIAAQEFFEKNNWESLPGRIGTLVRRLDDWVEKKEDDLLYVLSSDPREARLITLTAAVFTWAPDNFLESFRLLFQSSLRDRQERWEDLGTDNLELEGELPWFENLRRLRWLHNELLPTLSVVLRETILEQVRSNISGEFEEEGLLESFEPWKEAVIVPWVEGLIGKDQFQDEGWSTEISMCLAECFCVVRMEEIFEIVADYPDSRPAVMELCSVLDETHMQSELASRLEKTLIRRLLHPGANTSQIIDVYINTIKVLREIDPSDRLLEVVAEPVRTYLRGRSDTIRCIITSLTDEETGGDLYDELRRQDAKPLEETHEDSDDEEEPPSLDWMPPPPLSKQRGEFFGSAPAKTSLDILSILVSIYGSKELFVDEYRVMLADKLLTSLDFSTDRDVHTLELLKLRFGDTSMRQCEIMIKDTDDSKRIVSNIHSTIAANDPAWTPVVDAAVISHIFWPKILREPFSHHPRLKSELDKFSEAYGQLKNPRRLVWYDQLGTVELDLDVLEEDDDGSAVLRTKSISCTPLHATIITHFEDKDGWTAEELSEAVGLPEHTLQKKMAFWINQRVVVKQDGLYRLAAADGWLHEDSGQALLADDDQVVAIGGNDEAEMEVFESYIVGMLKRLRELSLDRIHSMLKMFATGSDHTYNKTPRQLSAFLQRLCREEKLECGPDGMYKLVEK